jgi:hypothetical protein
MFMRSHGAGGALGFGGITGAVDENALAYNPVRKKR